MLSCTSCLLPHFSLNHWKLSQNSSQNDRNHHEDKKQLLHISTWASRGGKDHLWRTECETGKHSLHFPVQIAVVHLCPSVLGTMAQGELMPLSTDELTFQVSSNSALKNTHKNYLGLHQRFSFALSGLVDVRPRTEWVETGAEKSASVKQHKLKKQRSFLQGRTGVCCRTRSETWNLCILPFIFSLTFSFKVFHPLIHPVMLAMIWPVCQQFDLLMFSNDNWKRCFYKCISAQGCACQRKSWQALNALVRCLRSNPKRSSSQSNTHLQGLRELHGSNSCPPRITVLCPFHSTVVSEELLLIIWECPNPWSRAWFEMV